MIRTLRTVQRRKRKTRRKAPRRDDLATFLRDQSWAMSPCHYYVVEFEEGILKPGITSDFNRRCRTASKDGHSYGTPLFVSKRYPRAWVWLAEQIILRETASHYCRVLPTSLKHFPGKTELRRNTLSIEWILDRFQDLMEEIQTFGFYHVSQHAT